MSALTDLFEGNIGNIGHDLTAHPLQDLGYAAAIGGTALGGLGLLGLGPLSGALGGIGGDIGAGISSIGDTLGGIGSGIGTALGFGGDAAAGGAGAATGALDSFAAVPGATTDLSALGAAAPAGASAGAVSAPAGISSALGADPTAALSGIPNVGSAGGDISAGAGVGDLGGSTGGGGGFFDTLGKSLSPGNIASGIGNSVAKNPLGLALATGGLGYNILEGQKNSAAVNALGALANQQGQLGSQLEGYLTSGTLPPGLQASVTQAVQAAKAHAISNAAGQGLSTDPNKNTALASTLAAIDQQVPILTAQIGQQLLSTGVTASGLASNVYAQLAAIDQTQTANIGKSIASMAAALSGKTTIPGTNLAVSAA